jgi:hypothetical protein
MQQAARLSGGVRRRRLLHVDRRQRDAGGTAAIANTMHAS